MNYLTLDELKLRQKEKLPCLPSGEVDDIRCQAAIEDASAIIRSYLPQLIGEDGTPVAPPARIAGTVKAICVDIVMYRLDERPGEEHVNARYKSAIALLEALAGGGSSQGGSGASGSGFGGIEPLDSDDSAFIEGTSEFIKPAGRAH